MRHLERGLGGDVAIRILNDARPDCQYIAPVSLAVSCTVSADDPFSVAALAAVVLLASYVLYLIFLLKTHPDYFASASASAESGHHGPQWSTGRALGSGTP